MQQYSVGTNRHPPAAISICQHPTLLRDKEEEEDIHPPSHLVGVVLLHLVHTAKSGVRRRPTFFLPPRRP